MKLKVRDPMSVGTVVSSVIVIAILEGSIYYKMPMGDWQNRIAGTYCLFSGHSFSPV